MACMQEIRASSEYDFSEKNKTVNKGSQGCNSSEHMKHDHKSAAYSSQGGGYPASVSKHATNTSGHLSLTEKITGIFGSNKGHQSSGCNTHVHQTATHGSHGHQTTAHGSHGHQTTAHGGYGSHGHQTTALDAYGSHGHQTTALDAYGSHGHQTAAHNNQIIAGCGSHGHSSHHKASSQGTYEFEEKKKEYTSSKSGRTKVEKKIKKLSYKSSSSDSESDSDKEHC